MKISIAILAVLISATASLAFDGGASMIINSANSSTSSSYYSSSGGNNGQWVRAKNGIEVRCFCKNADRNLGVCLKKGKTYVDVLLCLECSQCTFYHEVERR